MDSDQTTLNKTTGAVSLLRGARTRVTSIQGRGEAGSVLLLRMFKLTTYKTQQQRN